MKLSERAKSYTDKLIGYFEASEVKQEDSDEENEKKKAPKDINLFGCSMNRSKEIELFEKTNEEKMALFKEYKELGNEGFREKDYDKASYYYNKVRYIFINEGLGQ